MTGVLDATAEDTYAAVGLALTRWEIMETGLADLYSVFRGMPFDKRVMVGFGQRYSTTVRRLAGLADAASRYFVRWPSQEREGEFKRLLFAVETLSLDRHRIAHGLVDLVHFGTANGGIVSGYALNAPWYAESRLKMTVNDAWGSAIITRASDRFMLLDHEITAFAGLLLTDRS